jgi:hypothetical protein
MLAVCSSRELLTRMAKLPKSVARQLAVAKTGTDVPSWFPLLSVVFGFVCVAVLAWMAMQPTQEIARPPLSQAAPAPTSSTEGAQSPSSPPRPSATESLAVPVDPAPQGPTRTVKTVSGTELALPAGAVDLAELALAAATDPAKNAALPWANPAYREQTISASTPSWGTAYLLNRDPVAPYVFAATVYPNGPASNTSTQVVRTVVADGDGWKLGTNS